MTLAATATHVNAAEDQGKVYVHYWPNGMPSYSQVPEVPGAQLLLKWVAPPARPRSAGEATLARLRTRPSTIADMAKASADIRALWQLNAASSLDGPIRAAALAYQVEEAFIRAVIAVESNFNPVARSHAGAAGLMQLMPGTAQRYGVRNPLNPLESIDGGTRYLRDLLDLFGGDKELALAGYNAGEGAVIRHGRRIPPYAETIAYVPKVMAHYRNFRTVR